jgi:hypothetical protein
MKMRNKIQTIFTVKKILNKKKEPDKTIEKMRDYIYEIAENLVRQDSIYAKKLKNGALIDGYPTEVIKKATLIHSDKSLWESTMLYPTAVWRTCVFPQNKINYISYCRQKLAISKTQVKVNGK